MANFLGFKQVTLATYQALTDDARKNYLWLVRKMSGDTEVHSAIYFGNRLYAEVNKTDETVVEKVNNIINSLGDAIDAEGNFLGFLPLEEHEILGDESVTDITAALSALEAAILANKADIADVEARVEAAESAITDNAAAIEAVDEKVNAVDEKVDAVDAKADALDERIAELESAGTQTEAAIEELKAKDAELETAIEGKADAEDVEALEARVEAAESAITDNAATIEELKAKDAELETAIEGKADAEDVEALEARVEAAESAITEVEAALDNVYTKDEVYNKDEIDGKIAGVFHFKGKKDSIEELPTDAEIGDVWQVGDKEYAWNGTEWVELGTPIDLSAYATKEFVNDEIGKVNEAITALTEEVAVAEAAIEKEIEDRSKADEEINDAIDALEKKATTTAQTYDDATAMDLELGQIVYIKESEAGESGHTAGAYICTGKDGDLVLIQKLEASSGTGETPLDRIVALENQMGKTALPEDKTVTSLVTELYNGHVIDGDDVEE